jgi:predicted DCC family thiol-disulfide oxidoreductase YuxK/uncharacterized integral membrane protein
MSDIYFIYDEECPLCSYAAHALRIKQSVGNLHLIDARDPAQQPWVQKVNERGLDLDEGMVILYEGNFYHGQDALHLMGLLATDIGWFNKVNAFLFRSKPVAQFCYPFMRAVRNALIRARGVSRIDNLGKAAPQTDHSAIYSIRNRMRWTAILLTFLATIIRLVSAFNQWDAGSKTAIESYSFCVIFPAILIIVLAFMKGTKTKEGLLMRFGTMVQLLLIICLPPLALYLALGLPVVFLVVELLVTRLPLRISRPLERMII